MKYSLPSSFIPSKTLTISPVCCCYYCTAELNSLSQKYGPIFSPGKSRDWMEPFFAPDLIIVCIRCILQHSSYYNETGLSFYNAKSIMSQSVFHYWLSQKLFANWLMHSGSVGQTRGERNKDAAYKTQCYQGILLNTYFCNLLWCSCSLKRESTSWFLIVFLAPAVYFSYFLFGNSAHTDKFQPQPKNRLYVDVVVRRLL